MENQLAQRQATKDLTSEEEEKIQEIASGIHIQDHYAILQYGVEVQKNISTFTDNILSEVRAKDAGYVGEIMNSLMLKVKGVNVEGLMPRRRGFFSKIPFLGSLADEVEKFMIKYEKLSSEIERIVSELEKAKDQLMRDIIMFDHLYGKNMEYFQQLDLYIKAGQLKLRELKETLLSELKEKAGASGDTFEAQQYQDMCQLMDRFEKKIHDLQLSRTISLQTAPQIRLIQSTNQVLVEKIQSSIMSTIPLWKNQIVIAISLFRQGRVLEMQREVNKTTNELLLKNSELLKENTTETVRESERGIVEIETLRKVHENLLNTIEEAIKIQEEGRLKRRSAETELENIEKELKSKLMNM